jgi:hypothetical protein
MEWIHLAQDMDHWRDSSNIVMKGKLLNISVTSCFSRNINPPNEITYLISQ